MGVNAEIQLAEGGEILHHLRFRHFGQRQVVAQPGGVGERRRGYVRLRRDCPYPAGYAAIHQQPDSVSVSAFVQHFPFSPN